ncbi:MAG: hypothetical protein CVU41_17120 [Chloroflexi bacterium HGW-Chloroflexi-3]|nr:MAG: hypothetical protein CVU41_17120 [Chloroflexi bacterium HGW-Chloroflexi-3]
MIQLGMTDCPVVRQMLDDHQLELDYLEVHGPYAQDARTAFPEMPMLLHNALYQWSLTHSDGLEHKNAAQVTMERLALSRSPWYSLHLGFSVEEVDFYDEAMQGLSSLQPRDQVQECCIARLKQLKALLPVPILIENLDYNPTQAYEFVCEPDFIQEVLAETDTWLLFDLAHARVTAHAFGISIEDYIAQLPLEKIRQIHLNHPGWRDGRLVDAHLALEEEDYPLFEQILSRCQPWSVTLEYNHDPENILSQIKRLREILNR